MPGPHDLQHYYVDTNTGNVRSQAADDENNDRIKVDKRFCLIFTLSSIVFILLGAGAYALYQSLTADPEDYSPSLAATVCTTPSCIETSHRVLSKMDLHQDPCEDSYSAYCGKWSEETQMPSDMSLIDTSFTKINHDIREEVKSILDTWGCKVPSTIHPTNEIEGWRTLAGCMYSSCQNESLLKDAGSKPLLSHIRNHIPFLLDSDLESAAAPPSEEIPKLLGKVLAHLTGNNVASFIISYSHQHPTDSDKPGSIPHLGATGLGLGYDIYVASDEAAKSLRQKYVTHISKLFELYDKARRNEDPNELRTSSTRATYLERAVDVLELETRLRSIQLSPAEARDPVLTTHVVSFKEAAKLGEDAFDLRAYFEELTLMGVIQRSHYNIYFQDDSEIVIDQPEYYKKLAGALFPGDDADKSNEWNALMDYFLLRSMRSVLSYLGGEWLEERRRYTQAVSGVDQAPARYKECLQTVRNSLGWIVGEAFITANGADDAKQRRQLAQQIVDDVRSAFRVELNNLEWMDDETRKEAELKEEKLVARLGFPEWVIANPTGRILKMYGPSIAARDYLLTDQTTSEQTKSLYTALVNRDWDSIQVKNDDLLDATMDKWDFQSYFLKLSVYLDLSGMKFAWSDLGTVTDPHIWSLTPDVVNAYYAPSLNEMVFPASIFRPPFMELPNEDDSDLARIGKLALTYGALGAVAGHELTHAFDDAGSTMDGDGLLRNWWTEESRVKFEKASNCLVRQYSAFPVVGLDDSVRVNGLLTLGENIADAGGLKLAMLALNIALEREPAHVKEALTLNMKSTSQKLNHATVNKVSSQFFSAAQKSSVASKSESVPELLPGLTLTPTQLAVTAFAQVWCTKSKVEVLRSQVASDPHAPGASRVIGSVRNLQSYREMFGCSKDSALSPDELGGSRDEGELQCSVW